MGREDLRKELELTEGAVNESVRACYDLLENAAVGGRAGSVGLSRTLGDAYDAPMGDEHNGAGGLSDKTGACCGARSEGGG